MILAAAAVLAVGLTTAAFAAVHYDTPAEIVAGLTGKSLDEVIAARRAGNTYGAQASEAGKLEEFQQDRLDQYEENLKNAVADGTLSQARADELLLNMKARMADCDGQGIGAGEGSQYGNRMGTCDGTCDGTGRADGSGFGQRSGRGGMGCGSCTAE